MMMIAATAAPAFADASADAVKSGMLALAKLSSYHLTVDDGKGKKVDVDYGGPTKEHVVIGSMEAIILGDSVYVKPQGSWMKMPAAASGMMTGAFSMAIAKAHETMNQETFTATDLGMKTVDGEAYHAYNVKSGKDSRVNVMYINHDGILSRISSANGKGDTSWIVISKMNVPVTITAPV